MDFRSPQRRGVILLVVLSLLTLFALVGLSFVLYAGNAARTAQLARDRESLARPDVDPELLLSFFLGQLIHDVPDDETGVYSALRGHSLARNMYGANSQSGANLVAYNGTGRLRDAPSPFGAVIGDYPLLNYTFHRADGFLRDPERLGWRQPDLSAPRGPFTGGFNAGYTYPDLNSPFLAAVRADGAVLLPSFHRPWAVEPMGVAGDFFDRAANQRNPLWEANAVLPPWYKYTTLRPLPALNPGFPPPEDGGGDVKNLVGGPGTFRTQTGPTPEFWNNDSFWMDLGFPVLTAPDGRRFKPLFAALITDLDNRLNLNVHGNVAGAGFQHRSNQGWGPWEVNVARVLDRPNQPPDEVSRLLRGVSRIPPSPLWEGRYGPDQLPSSRHPSNEAPATIRAHFYGQIDFDGRNETANGAPTPPWDLPGPTSPFGVRSAFPTFGPGFGNASTAERIHHPLLYDVFAPTRTPAQGHDRVFALSNMEALLRYGDTGSPALSADLFRLCPSNFQDARLRGLVTTHSFDLDRPGAPPWIFNAQASAYDMPASEDVDRLSTPRGPAFGFRLLTERGTAPFDARLDRGEFGGADWRSLLSTLGRVNLNRPLPPYPHQGSGTLPPFGPPLTRDATGQVMLTMPFTVDAPQGPIWNQFLAAQTARQQLADDLYRRLLLVTGVAALRPEHNPQQPPAELLRTRRWLAQLAVNIVDYLDEDDIGTPFQFYTAADSPAQPPDPNRVDPARPAGLNGEIQWPLYWVFGTELPRVVVNEVMAQIGRNDPDEAYEDAVRVFVELHNPMPRGVPPGTYQPDSLPVPLRMGTGSAAYAPYRVQIGTKRVVTLPTGEEIAAAVLPGPDNDNVLGNPDLAAIRLTTTDDDFTGAPPSGGPPWPPAAGYVPVEPPFVPPHGPDTATLPQGFLLLGPPALAPDPAFVVHDPFRTAIPAPTPLLRTPHMQYQRLFLDEATADERRLGVCVLLRRLANPYLPFDGRPFVGAQPNPRYNPFVTVDYLEDIPLLPVRDNPPAFLAARGKPQPYAAHRGLLAEQMAGPPPVLHSFGRENLPHGERYDWLTHLDRPLISPAELLHVSGCQPYQLTQRFLSPDPSSQFRKHNHRAPWLDDDLSGGTSHRLYRLLDFVETGPKAAGMAAGGRLPGKVNLNTIWDRAIFRALADAQPSNHFTEADVDRLFTQLVHDPSASPRPEPRRRTQGPIPGPKDHPFWGLSVGGYPSGDRQMHTLGGVDDTILRLRHGLPATTDHPYVNAELLTKISDHLTTRSNVFAVWLTVGFFEVTDDTTRPVKLGAELGSREGRQLRHRMFAILDRTNLSIATGVAELSQPVIPPPAPPHPAPLPSVTVPVSAVNGVSELSATGPSLPWRIDPGATLVIDVGANQEVVEVLAVNRQLPAIQAILTKPHAKNAPISLANVPGAPPIFLKPVQVTEAGSSPQRTYTVTLPLDPARRETVTRAEEPAALAGVYDGIPWSLRIGTKLLIDVGPNQEWVEVQGPLRVDRQAGTGTFQFTATRAHLGDFLLSNTLLGSPGPQPRYNPRDPTSAAVVRYFSIIQ